MTQVFGAAYSEVYDTFYRDKDYELECDSIESLLCAAGPLRILDLGCGTGGHAQVLARRGHKVVGVDCSADMITVAQRKAGTAGGSSRANYKVDDLRNVRLEQSFDAVLMMFAVLGYQTREDDVLAALRTARAHLTKGGSLLCDFWYGPAVLAQRPSARTRTLDSPKGLIRRSASAHLDSLRRICTVNIAWNEPGGADERAERHAVRYYFPEEIQLLTRTTGFAIDRFGAWPETDKPADETTWNSFLLARAV